MIGEEERNGVCYEKKRRIKKGQRVKEGRLDGRRRAKK